MILTDNQIKKIIHTYTEENNVDIEKYKLYDCIKWYDWWWKQTLIWRRPATDYTYEEGKEEIIGYIKHIIYEQDWEDQYGYKGNYDGCRKFCEHCKYSAHTYKNEICSGAINKFCTKLSEKYKIPVEILGNDNICKYYKSIFNDELDFEEYYDWLCKAWYIDNKGETTINNKTKSIIINGIRILVSYVIFKDLDFIKDNKITCTKYYGGKRNKNNIYSVSGKDEILINDIMKNNS